MSGSHEYVHRSFLGRWLFRLRNALTVCPHCHQLIAGKQYRLILTWSDGSVQHVCRFCAYQRHPEAVMWAERELSERGLEP